MKRYFVSGIDTNVGKSIVSAILVKALQADYWKPVQSGDLNNSDSSYVSKLLKGNLKVFPETFRLNHSLSPHISAKLDLLEINLSDFALPETNRNLIIEGAGGLLVPLNYKGDYIADLIKQLDVEVILVAKNYLGSINHTLLSLHYLQQQKIPVAGIVINGEANEPSEEIIVRNTGVPVIHHVPWTDNLSPEFIEEQAAVIKAKLFSESTS